MIHDALQRGSRSFILPLLPSFIPSSSIFSHSVSLPLSLSPILPPPHTHAHTLSLSFLPAFTHFFLSFSFSFLPLIHSEEGTAPGVVGIPPGNAHPCPLVPPSPHSSACSTQRRPSRPGHTALAAGGRSSPYVLRAAA